MSALSNEEMWQAKAACRGPHASVFFPPTSFERKNDKIKRERRAKAICKQCSVMQECRDYALGIRERHGIWGGLNELERQDILGQQLL